MRKDMNVAGWRRWTLVAVLGLVAVNALVAAYGFVGDPDGSSVGIPLDWLADTPFRSYLVPALVLGALGLLYAFAAIRELQRARDAWFWAGLSGGAMLVWIAVQVYMMGYDRHPIQTALQVAVLVAGLVSGALAFSQMRDVRAARPSPA